MGRAARGKQDKPPLARTPGCHPCAGRFRIGWRPNNTHMQWDEQESNAEGMRGTGRTARGAHKNAHSRDLHAFRTHQRGLQAGWRPSDSLKLCCGIWAMLCAHRGGWARRPWVQGWAARAFGPNAHRHRSQRQSRQVPHALDRRARPHHPRAHIEKKRRSSKNVARRARIQRAAVVGEQAHVLLGNGLCRRSPGAAARDPPRSRQSAHMMWIENRVRCLAAGSEADQARGGSKPALPRCSPVAAAPRDPARSGQSAHIQQPRERELVRSPRARVGDCATEGGEVFFLQLPTNGRHYCT